MESVDTVKINQKDREFNSTLYFITFSTMSSIKLIRVNSIQELDQLVDLACEIWIDDPIFSCVVPGRREHPDQYRQLWQLLLRTEYSAPGAVVMVACDGSSGDIADAVGFAVWHRHGSSDTAGSWQGDTLRKSKSPFTNSKRK